MARYKIRKKTSDGSEKNKKNPGRAWANTRRELEGKSTRELAGMAESGNPIAKSILRTRAESRRKELANRQEEWNRQAYSEAREKREANTAEAAAREAAALKEMSARDEATREAGRAAVNRVGAKGRRSEPKVKPEFYSADNTKKKPRRNRRRKEYRRSHYGSRR